MQIKHYGKAQAKESPKQDAMNQVSPLSNKKSGKNIGTTTSFLSNDIQNVMAQD